MPGEVFSLLGVIQHQKCTSSYNVFTIQKVPGAERASIHRERKEPARAISKQAQLHTDRPRSSGRSSPGAANSCLSSSRFVGVPILAATFCFLVMMSFGYTLFLRNSILVISSSSLLKSTHPGLTLKPNPQSNRIRGDLRR